MSFLQLSTGAMLVLLAATAAATLILYWLKPPPSRVVVPSMFIWSRVLKERKRRSDFWRWLVSLLVALTVGLALAGAVGRPEIAGPAGPVAVILDNSPTMGALTASGETRFQVGRERARAILEAGASGSRFLVADTAGQLPRMELGSRREALDRLDALTMSLDETEILAETRAVESPDGDEVETVVVTDGVLVRDLPPGATVISVFEPADNVGITAFDLRAVPAEATRHEAFLELVNHSDEEKRVLVQLDGAAGVSRQRSVVLQPGEVRGEILGLEEFPSGPVRALIDAPGDGFELDDVAYAFLGSLRRVRVVLVTPGNTYLETLLGLDPRISLEVVPAARAADAVRPDVYVFDRYAPPDPPDAPALAFDPPAVSWLAPRTGRVLEGLSLAGAVRSHPITEHVSLADVVVERAETVDASDHTVVVGTALEPIIVAGETPVRWTLVTFDLASSNLPLQSSFPVLLANAIDWLTGVDVSAASLRTLAVPVPFGVVTDLEGREVPARASAGGTTFAPSAPGLYSVRGRGREIIVAANLLSPRVSAVNDSVLSGEGAGAPVAVVTSGEVSEGMGELWLGLLVAALVLVLVEWWTYHRRMTV